MRHEEATGGTQRHGASLVSLSAPERRKAREPGGRSEPPAPEGDERAAERAGVRWGFLGPHCMKSENTRRLGAIPTGRIGLWIYRLRGRFRRPPLSCIVAP